MAPSIQSTAVRRATPEDYPAMAATLARAFYDDPVTTYFYGNDKRRLSQAERFFRIRLRQLAPQDELYTTADHTGAALWAKPDAWREDLRQALMIVPLLPALMPRLVRASKAVREIERRHPSDPHYYLSVLGTDPDHQGRGIGGRLMAPVLAHCDATGQAAYLESSKESNVGFYEKHGFRVTETLILPDGPPLWLMWRAPRGGGG